MTNIGDDIANDFLQGKTLSTFKKIVFPKCPDHMDKDNRNRCIRQEYNEGQGASIPDLIEKYELSKSQIYKILEKKS